VDGPVNGVVPLDLSTHAESPYGNWHKRKGMGKQ